MVQPKMPLDGEPREPGLGDPIVTEESRRAYIQNLLVVAADDAKNLTLISTVAVATAAFAAKELAAPLSHEATVTKVIALVSGALILAGAILFYFYAAAVNHTRMAIAHSLITTDALRARELWAGDETGIWRRKGMLWRLGAAALVVGCVLGGAVVGFLFLR
jgi:hypothetical protein